MKNIARILLTCVLTQSVLAQEELNQNFIAKAVGRYELVEASDIDQCMVSNVRVESHSAKNAELGQDCGAVLWIAGADEPMGVIFCNADKRVEKKPVKIDFGVLLPQPLVASETGRISDDAVIIVMEAKDAIEANWVNKNLASTKDTLTLTKIGVDLETIYTMTDGKNETVKCSYIKKRQSR